MVMTNVTKEQLVVAGLPDYEPEIGRLLWMLEETRQRTKRGLEGLTDDLLAWSPAPTENTIGALIYHIAAIEADWLYVEILEGQPFPPDIVAIFPEDVRDEHWRLAAAHGTSLAANLDRLDSVRERLLAAFRGMSLAEFRRIRDLPDYGVTPEWVLHHLMQHEAEHRGQIGVIRGLAEQAAGRG
jgi:uncharacterized damage-inducible protein DinB